MSARDGGESSRERSATRENGDDASDERPLKKARFAWQVKGKYRLKQTEEPQSASVQAPERQIKAEGAGEVPASAEQNLEILGDYLLKQDLSLVETSADRAAEAHAGEGRRRRASCDAPPSLVVRARRTLQDRYLEAWQARQMAKGFVDNTINRVLDSWSSPRLQRVAELTDELPATASVEDEGIRAAISVHGLQHYRLHQSRPEVITKTPRDEAFDGEATTGVRVTAATCDAASPSSTPHQRPHFCCHSLPRDLATRSLPRDLASRSLPRDLASRSLPRDLATRAHPTAASAPELATFMDAAVAFAIQNKGLTSLGYEYG